MLLVLAAIGVGCEVAARLTLVGLARWTPDPRAAADGYAGETWPGAYFKEWRSAPITWQPYVTWRHVAFHGTDINIDANGVRRSWQPPAEGSRKRLWVFGGSTVWGIGARDEHTLPSALARALAGAGAAVDVVNHGQTGYVTGQDVVHLMRRLREGPPPDVVVLYGGPGDVLAAWQSGQAGEPQNEANRRIEFNSTQPDNVQSVWRVVTTGLHKLVGGVRGATGAGVTQPSAAVQEDLARAVLAQYLADVRVLDSLATGYGFRYLVVWPPVVTTKPVRTAYEERQMQRFAGLWPLYARVRELMAAAPELASPRWMDASAVFQATNEPVYVDAFHLTEKGYRAVADAALPALAAITRDVR
jgi:lysophospholipase L1-like esterase